MPPKPRQALSALLFLTVGAVPAAQVIVDLPDENAVAHLIGGFGLFSLSKDVTGGSFRIRNGGDGAEDTRLQVFKLPWETDLEVGHGPGTLFLEAAAALLTADDHLEVDTPSGPATVSQDWFSAAALVGVGWTHPIGAGWWLRPGVALSLGYTENEARYNAAGQIELAPAIDGTLVNWDAWSASGIASLTLLHARALGPVELELESRYAWTETEVFEASSDFQEGRDSGQLWLTRVDLDGPTDWTLRGQGVRWTSFLGFSHLPSARDSLGFTEFWELGAGLELPRIGRIPPLALGLAWVTGLDLRGWSLGLSLAD
jgi:hypothetical protein